MSKESKGTKFDKNKPRMDLIPIEFLIGIAKSFTAGLQDHSEHNFRDGIQFSRLLASALRHIQLELAGVEIDEGTKTEHWMNAAASLAMYAFMKYHRKDMDDLFKYTEEEKKKIVELMYEHK